MITDRKLASLKAKAKRYTVALGDNLFVRITPTGNKSFVLRYTSFGKTKDITLGAFPYLSIKQAIQKAHVLRKQHSLPESTGITLKDVYKVWRKKKQGLASFKTEAKKIETHILAPMGDISVDEITAPLVFQHMSKHTAHLPTLRRVLMRINELLDIAVYMGLIGSNPCKGLSRAFAIKPVVHRKYIPAEQLHLLFKAVADSSTWFKCYVLWATYTMLRPKECAHVRWDWIDGDVLTMPASEMKKRRIHRVPLCAGVLEMLAFVRSIGDSRHKCVWSFGARGRCISGQYLTRWLHGIELGEHMTHHGLRSTGRTWLRDQEVAHEVAEDCLAHVTGTATERSYLRGDFLEQRKEIMRKWWEFITTEWVKCNGELPYK